MSPIRVAFGVTALTKGLAGRGVDGIGRVTLETLEAASAMHDVTLLPFAHADAPPDVWPGAIAVGSYQAQALGSLMGLRPFGRMQTALEGRVDVVHATDHFIPRLRGIPVLATIMDAIPLVHPEWVGYRCKRIKNRLWLHSARWADHVVTISEWSRREISHWFGIPEQRISVVPPGVGRRWFEPVDETAFELIRKRHDLPERFFFSLGTLQPRKNLSCIIRAHAALPARLRRSVPLLIAGQAGNGSEALAAGIEALKDQHVRWLGYVPDADLPGIVSRATALLFPSLHEGFGLPVVEGFAAGTPVLASQATAIPETAGNAAILLDPLSPMDWSEAMAALADDRIALRELVAAGKERARGFVWTASAQRLADIYRMMLDRSAVCASAS